MVWACLEEWITKMVEHHSEHFEREIKKDVLSALFREGGETYITDTTMPSWKTFGVYNTVAAIDSLVEDGIVLLADKNGRGIRFAKGKFASE